MFRAFNLQRFFAWDFCRRSFVSVNLESVSHSVLSHSLRPHGLCPPGSSAHGMFQARMLEWVAIPFSEGSSQPRDWTWVSCITGRFFVVWSLNLHRFLVRDFCKGSFASVKWSESHSVVSDCLWPHGLYSPWNSPGQNTGVGSGSFLQGIFPTQRSNPGLPHCRQILYQLSHKGSPRILEWVAYPFTSRTEPGSPALQVDSYQLSYQGSLHL